VQREVSALWHWVQRGVWDQPWDSEVVHLAQGQVQEEVVAESDSLVDAAVWESVVVAVSVSPLLETHPVPLQVHPELVVVPELWKEPLMERLREPQGELLEVAAALRVGALVAVLVEVEV